MSCKSLMLCLCSYISSVRLSVSIWVNVFIERSVGGCGRIDSAYHKGAPVGGGCWHPRRWDRLHVADSSYQWWRDRWRRRSDEFHTTTHRRQTTALRSQGYVTRLSFFFRYSLSKHQKIVGNSFANEFLRVFDRLYIRHPESISYDFRSDTISVQRRRGLKQSELHFVQWQLQICDRGDYHGAQKFNFAHKFLKNGGFLAPRCCIFLEKKFFAC